MKVIVFVLSLLSVTFLNSQSILRSSISSVGNSLGSDYKIIQTVGQLQPSGEIGEEETVKQGFLSYGSFGITSIEEQEDYLIYPNPVSSELYTGLFESIRIIAINGTVVSEGIANNYFDLTYLSPGVYLVEINRGNNKLENHKIIKN